MPVRVYTTLKSELRKHEKFSEALIKQLLYYAETTSGTIQDNIVNARDDIIYEMWSDDHALFMDITFTGAGLNKKLDISQ